MTVCYLEVDDEITGAIARLRAVKDGEAIIVVPPGSRIATSRINFKLLAREGNERRLNVVAVSDEPQTRALALSAGLPAYDSLPAAEQALANFRDQDRRLAERLGTPADELSRPAAQRAGEADAEATQVLPATQAGGSLRETRTARAASTLTVPREMDSPPRRRATDRVDSEVPGRRIGLVPIAAVAVLFLLLAGVAYGAYMFLPTATITLSPATTTFNPGTYTVTADPDAAVPDLATGVVPAQRLQIPLSVTGEFSATGIDVRETRATGVVRFRSENTLNEVPVIEGTVISTSDRIEFETTQAAVVPRADFTTSTPGTVDVPVRAVRAGTRGNVAADAITEVGAGLRQQLVSVRNPDPTDGGRRIEESVVQQSDYDAALAALGDRLETELAAALDDPATTPRGLTLFISSARTGDPEPDQLGSALVGTPAVTFELTLTSTGTVTAVNETAINDLAAERLSSLLPDDQQIAGEDITTSHSEGTLDVESVRYEVDSTALVYRRPDIPALSAAVRGKSITEARSILAPYGMVEISIWPEFVDRLPDQTSRISLVVMTPSPRP
jgi:hypothetical protein